MTRTRRLVWLVLFAVALPVASAQAQPQRAPQQAPRGSSPAWENGYSRGSAAGEYDGRRGGTPNFSVQQDYRRGDFGYRPQLGDFNRYSGEFRRGFEAGYCAGFDRFDRRPGSGGRYGGTGWYRTDLAFDRGIHDGYDEGFEAGRRNHRFDPIREGRYRSGDHGYERWYGSRDLYRYNYRAAFQRGYEQGFRDGARRDGVRSGLTFSFWWPF